jgi:hypothetical protein
MVVRIPGAMDLDPETLQLALNAARLSSLAYRTPIQVEYLRLRANKKTQEEALEVIKCQVGGLRAMCRREYSFRPVLGNRGKVGPKYTIKSRGRRLSSLRA